MPFTPLIGLSTFADIFLIIIYKLFNLKSNKYAMIEKKNSLRTLLGSFIILVVFSFVFVSAVFTVGASAMEKHSSIHFIENHISYIDNLVNRSNILAVNVLH